MFNIILSTPDEREKFYENIYARKEKLFSVMRNFFFILTHKLSKKNSKHREKLFCVRDVNFFSI